MVFLTLNFFINPVVWIQFIYLYHCFRVNAKNNRRNSGSICILNKRSVAQTTSFWVAIESVLFNNWRPVAFPVRNVPMIALCKCCVLPVFTKRNIRNVLVMFNQVCPKPPLPLAVSFRLGDSTHCARQTFEITICARRIPLCTKKGSLPWLMTIRAISPR